MIEISNIKKIEKKCLLAKCDVRVVPWGWNFWEVLIFEKGARRWIMMPSKETTGMDGEIKYKEFGGFDSEETTKRFKAEVLVAVNKYLEKNPDMEPESAIKGSELFQF